MRKPKNYDQVEVNTGWEPLEVGGHYLEILSVEERMSKNNQSMLVVMFDTAANDKQPKYFRSNHEKGRYYQGTTYILNTDDEWAVRRLKQFVTSVEHSNPGFEFDWNINSFRGKKVGGVFGQEEYINQNNEVKTSVKLRWFCGIDKVETASIPKRKEVENKPKTNNSSYFDPLADSDLPFDL